MLNQLIVASKLIARRSITLTGSTTGIRQPQFLFLGHINIEFTQLGQCWRVPQTSGFIQEGQTIGSRVLNTGTITNHCPHIIEPLRHIQIYHLLIEIQCLLRIFFYSSGPPCTIKIRQIMHGLPMTALHCLAVKLDDTAPGPQSIGLGQGCCFAVPSIGLRIQRRQMVFFISADKWFAVGHHGDACKTEHGPKSNSHQPHHCPGFQSGRSAS
ncbi:hypothetical protein X778_09655 [Pseudomonas aeruginosa VRFPA07]|nr:hypothetical protein X778_09655 [Pseudomonas aeruginosa VRFPA07]